MCLSPFSTWRLCSREKIRREQVGTVSTFLSACTNKFAKWKTGFNELACLIYIISRVIISLQEYNFIVVMTR